MAEYIDRDILIKNIEQETMNILFTKSTALKYIRGAPAADVAEVRHGRWVVHFDHFAPYQKCSVCGFEIPLVATENEGGMCLYKHCPECTARMDKEDGHENN